MMCQRCEVSGIHTVKVQVHAPRTASLKRTERSSGSSFFFSSRGGQQAHRMCLSQPGAGQCRLHAGQTAGVSGSFLVILPASHSHLPSLSRSSQDSEGGLSSPSPSSGNSEHWERNSSLPLIKMHEDGFESDWRKMNCLELKEMV